MADGSDDDLEYYIKFPSTSPKELSPSLENDGFVFVYDEEKLPVVILFGWAGCQDKYLAKYSAIYEERGCITLRCTAPVLVTFVRHDKYPRLSVKLLDLLHDMTLDEHPIIFHIFSNGGAFFYQHVSLQMQRQNKKLQGSVLGPTLWNFAYSNLHKKMSGTNIHILSFAHDRLLVARIKACDLDIENINEQLRVLDQVLEDCGLQLEVKGVIFDSAPGEKRFYSVYRALSAIIGGSVWYKAPLAFGIALLIFLFFSLLAYLRGLVEFRKPQTDPIVLVDEPFNWPQLFIYSKDDELVRVEDVERFARCREDKGIRVERLCLESSPHVQHLLTDRDAYISTVVTFIQGCLDGDK